MTTEIKKIYTELANHANQSISEEAKLELSYQSGASSDKTKEMSLIKSMTKLSLLIALDAKKDEPNLFDLAFNTLNNAYTYHIAK